MLRSDPLSFSSRRQIPSTLSLKKTKCLNTCPFPSDFRPTPHNPMGVPFLCLSLYPASRGVQLPSGYPQLPTPRALRAPRAAPGTFVFNLSRCQRRPRTPTGHPCSRSIPRGTLHHDPLRLPQLTTIPVAPPTDHSGPSAELNVQHRKSSCRASSGEEVT